MARVKKNGSKSQLNIAIMFLALDKLEKNITYQELATRWSDIFDKYQATTVPTKNGFAVFFKNTDPNSFFIRNAIECGLEIVSLFKADKSFGKKQIRIGIHASSLNSNAKTRTKKANEQLAELISISEIVEKAGRWFEVNVSDSIREHVDVMFDLIRIKNVELKSKEQLGVCFIRKSNIIEPEPYQNYLKFKLSGREEIIQAIDKLLQPPYKKELRIDRYLPILIGLAGDPGMGRLRLVDTIVEQFFGHYRVPVGFAHLSLPGCNFMIVSLLCSIFRIDVTTAEQDIKSVLDNRFRELEKVYSNQKVQRWLKEHDRVFTDELKKLHDSKAIIGHLLGLKYSDNRLQYLDAKSLITEGHLALRYLLHAIAFELWLDSDQDSLFALVFENIHLAHPIDKGYIENLCNVFLSPMPLVLIFTSDPDFEYPENWLTPTCSKIFTLERLNQTKAREYICNILREAKPDESIVNLLLPELPTTYLKIEQIFFDMLMSGHLKPKKITVNEKKPKITWGLTFDYNHPDLREKLEHSADEPIVHPEFREIILNRFYLLPDNLALVLQVATVQGYQFIQHTIAQVFNNYIRDEDKNINLIESLKELQKLGWLKCHSSNEARSNDLQMYVFCNPVLQEVLYAEMDQRRKKKIHRVTAEYFESIMHRPYGHFISVTAFHWEHAKVWHKALDYYLKFAQYLIDAGHVNNALELYKHMENQFLPEIEWNKWLELHPEDGEPEVMIDLSQEEAIELDRIIKELIVELDIKDDKEIIAELGLTDIDLGLLPQKQS